jgi:hypothetical protein
MIAGVRKNACLGQGLCDFFVSFTGVCHLLVRYVTGPARTTEHNTGFPYEQNILYLTYFHLPRVVGDSGDARIAQCFLDNAG